MYKSGRVLGLGINSYKNEPKLFPNDMLDMGEISVHAEIAAMSKVSKENLKGATVYVARKGRCEVHLLSRPCNSCYEALVEAGVKKIIYTDF